jgi:hypothetical protein
MLRARLEAILDEAAYTGPYKRTEALGAQIGIPALWSADLMASEDAALADDTPEQEAADEATLNRWCSAHKLAMLNPHDEDKADQLWERIVAGVDKLWERIVAGVDKLLTGRGANG